MNRIHIDWFDVALEKRQQSAREKNSKSPKATFIQQTPQIIRGRSLFLVVLSLLDKAIRIFNLQSV